MESTIQNNHLTPGAIKPDYRKLLWMTLFAISMGMLESAVVIYMRELYYPGGFSFPVRATPEVITLTELLREVATVIMLLGIGMVAGKNNHQQFGWFLYTFAIWDIFYYVFLYLLIGWPVSFSDWDVLFLLPFMWVGPVWAPLFLSFLMVLLSQSIITFSDHTNHSPLKTTEWTALIAGSIIVIISFCKEYYLFMRQTHPTLNTGDLFYSKETFSYAAEYIPQTFDTRLFALGCAVIIAAIVFYIRRNTNTLFILINNRRMG